MKTNIIWLVLLSLSLSVNTYSSDSYPLPEGAEAILPCTKEEVLDFFKNLENKGISNCKIKKTDKGTEVCWDQSGHDISIEITEEGRIEGKYSKNPFHQFYKGKLGDCTFYILTYEHSGSGLFDGILSYWLQEEGSEIVPCNIHSDDQFPDYLADPFLITHEGKIYMRFMDGYLGHGGLGITSLKTYQLQGKKCTLEKPLSIVALPPERLNSPYFATLQKIQKLPDGYQAIEPCHESEIEHFVRLINKQRGCEKKPFTWIKGNLLYKGNFSNSNHIIYLLRVPYEDLRDHWAVEELWMYQLFGEELVNIDLDAIVERDIFPSRKEKQGPRYSETPYRYAMASPPIITDGKRFYLRFIIKHTNPDSTWAADFWDEEQIALGTMLLDGDRIKIVDTLCLPSANHFRNMVNKFDSLQLKYGTWSYGDE